MQRVEELVGRAGFEPALPVGQSVLQTDAARRICLLPRNWNKFQGRLDLVRECSATNASFKPCCVYVFIRLAPLRCVNHRRGSVGYVETPTILAISRSKIDCRKRPEIRRKIILLYFHLVLLALAGHVESIAIFIGQMTVQA